MRKLCTIFVLISAFLAGCPDEEPFTGLWQEEPCSSSPCLPRTQLHIGQYGESVAGIVTWFRTVSGINTFNSPSLKCGCQYIQAGSVDNDILRLTTYAPDMACSDPPYCNPCGCDKYVMEFSMTSDSRLNGFVQCQDGDRHEIELLKVLGTPKDICRDDVL